MAAPEVANAVAAPDANSVLILGPTVTGGAGSNEAVQSGVLGFTPVVVDAATWGATTAAEFSSFRAIVLGDPTCRTTTAAVSAAEANRAVWGPEIDGNVVINVTDPVFHQSQGGLQLTKSSIAFAGDEPTKTGAYISLSCYYFTVPEATPVMPPVIDPFGTFDVFGQLGGCPADSHIVAVHPALGGLTDASLSNWSCSTHGGFSSWPGSFNVLVIAEDLPALFTASDGSTGLPYVLARGEEVAPIACGDGVVMGDEECDDGNTDDGDGCSSTCRIEDNLPPVAQCTDVSVSADAGACEADASIDDGSFDPDGDDITLAQSPAGLYPVGMTSVTLTVEDTNGGTDMCSATVTVTDDEDPTALCNSPGTITPPDAPIAFTGGAVDNCGATVEVTGFDCFMFTQKGKRIDKTESCQVSIDGDTITILDSGGVGDHITWTVEATDAAGNTSSVECSLEVENPGQGGMHGRF